MKELWKKVRTQKSSDVKKFGQQKFQTVKFSESLLSELCLHPNFLVINISPKVNRNSDYRTIDEYLNSHSDEITMQVSETILSGNIDGDVDNLKYHIGDHVHPQSKVRQKRKS